MRKMLNPPRWRDNFGMPRVFWAVLFLAAGVALAKTPETTLVVSVHNELGKPVSDAAVILDFRGSHQVMKLGKRKPMHWEEHTNQDGVAHFPPIPQGAIQVQVIAERYQTYGNDDIELDSDQKTLEIKLKRPQKQYSAHEPH